MHKVSRKKDEGAAILRELNMYRRGEGFLLFNMLTLRAALYTLKCKVQGRGSVTLYAQSAKYRGERQHHPVCSHLYDHTTQSRKVKRGCTTKSLYAQSGK